MSELYWISKTVVVDWALVDLAGNPVTTSTVTGTITKPDGATAAMVVALVGNIQRATYDSTMAGTHAFALNSTGTFDSHEEGTFYVKPSLLGALPPTLNPTTGIGQVRLLVSDVDEDNLLFTDAQITGFLSIEDGVKRAAAAALEVIARSEVLVSKVIKTQDLTTDGAKVAAELRASAKALRDQADIDDENDDTDGGLDIVDYVDPREQLTWTT